MDADGRLTSREHSYFGLRRAGSRADLAHMGSETVDNVSSKIKAIWLQNCSNFHLRSSPAITCSGQVYIDIGPD